MSHAGQFYIDGQWVDPRPRAWFDHRSIRLLKRKFEQLAHGNAARTSIVLLSLRGARSRMNAQPACADRIAVVAAHCARSTSGRYEEFAEAMRSEMGAPIAFARNGQAARGPSASECADRTCSRTSRLRNSAAEHARREWSRSAYAG